MNRRVGIAESQDELVSDEERAFFIKDEPWGFIMFARDVDTPEQMAALTDTFQENIVRSQTVKRAEQAALRAAEELPVSSSALDTDASLWERDAQLEANLPTFDITASTFGFEETQSAPEELAVLEVEKPVPNYPPKVSFEFLDELSQMLDVPDSPPPARQSPDSTAASSAIDEVPLTLDEVAATHQTLVAPAPETEIQPEPEVQPEPVERAFVETVPPFQSAPAETIPEQSVEQEAASGRAQVVAAPDQIVTTRVEVASVSAPVFAETPADPADTISEPDPIVTAAVTPSAKIDPLHEFPDFDPTFGDDLEQEVEIADQISADFDELIEEDRKRKRFSFLESTSITGIGRSGTVALAVLFLAVLGVGAGMTWDAFTFGGEDKGGTVALANTASEADKTVVAQAGSGEAVAATKDELDSSKSSERITDSGSAPSPSEASEGNWVSTSLAAPGVTIARLGGAADSQKAGVGATAAPAFPQLADRFSLSKDAQKRQSTSFSKPSRKVVIPAEPRDTFAETAKNTSSASKNTPSANGSGSSTANTNSSAPEGDATWTVSAPKISSVTGPESPAPAAAPPKASPPKPKRVVAKRKPIRAKKRSTRKRTVSKRRPKSSPYSVQISAAKSRAEARSEYASLSDRYPGLIGGQGVTIRRAKVQGRGTFYRVRIPARSRSAADSMCAQLKARGGDCFVAR